MGNDWSWFTGEAPSVTVSDTSAEQIGAATAVSPLYNNLYNLGAGNTVGATMGGQDLNLRAADMGQQFQMGQISPLINEMMNSYGNNLGAYGGNAFHGNAKQTGMQNIIAQMLPGMLGRSMGFSQINPATIGMQAQQFASTPLQFGQGSIENVVNPGSTGAATPIATELGTNLGQDFMNWISGSGSGGNPGFFQGGST